MTNQLAVEAEELHLHPVPLLALLHLLQLPLLDCRRERLE